MMESSGSGDNEIGTTDNERAARVGFAQGRVVWFGGPQAWKEDWIFYLENEHTLVSMCRGHALHPFDRSDRISYFICVMCFSLFMSAYVNNEHPRSEGAFEYGGWLTLASILLVAYDYGLRFIATSPCMQPGGSLHGSCSCFRECCIDCGRQGLYVCLAGSFAFLVAGIVLAATSEDVKPGPFFVTFVAMKFCSFCAEIVPHAYSFYTRREQQRRYWFDGEAGGAYPLGPTFPDPLFIRESRKDGDVMRWPGEDGDKSTPRENPLVSSSRRRPLTDKDRAESKARRERQIEMLQRAREKVRSESSAIDNNPPADPLDSLGSRL